MDAAEKYGREVVKGRSLGFCQLGCGRPGTEWMHRVARGRGGSWAPVNGILGCSFHHRASHAAPRLSRDCGWMVETGTHPSTVPALITTQAGPGWWWLDEWDHDTNQPTSLARLAEPEEIPPGMWAGTLADAIAALRTRVA